MTEEIGDVEFDLTAIKNLPEHDAAMYLEDEISRQVFLDEFKNDPDEAKERAVAIVKRSRELEQQAGVRLNELAKVICNEVCELKGEVANFLLGKSPETELDIHLLYGNKEDVKDKDDVKITEGKRWVEIVVNLQNKAVEVRFLFGPGDQECESVIISEEVSDGAIGKLAATFIYTYLDHGITPQAIESARPSGTLLQ